MQLENFALAGDGISLTWQQHNLDLHNCFKFDYLTYNPLLQQVLLAWVRSPERWAISAALPGLKLLFKNVTFFKVKERDAAYPVQEDYCLQSVSLHPSEARGEFDSIYLQSSPIDDLTFFFQSEWGLKINAKSVELVPVAVNGG
jgi:hypothetical protein